MASLDLLHHAEHVPFLPTFDEHAVRHTHNRDPGRPYHHTGRSEAQAAAGVLARKRPAHANLIAIDHDVIDRDVDLRERRTQTIEERIEPLSAYRVDASLMEYGCRCEHLGDGFAPPFVPDLLEPAPPQVSLLFGHSSSVDNHVTPFTAESGRKEDSRGLRRSAGEPIRGDGVKDGESGAIGATPDGSPVL